LASAQKDLEEERKMMVSVKDGKSDALLESERMLSETRLNFLLSCYPRGSYVSKLNLVSINADLLFIIKLLKTSRCQFERKIFNGYLNQFLFQ